MNTSAILQCFLDAAESMIGFRDELCRLDLILGDGDHGVTIARGYQAVVDQVSLAPGLSIGSELCRQIATFGVERLILFDNSETPMHNLRLELEERFPYLSFVPVIGDVRLEQRLDYAFRLFRPQVVFHAAAYKHVPLMEENPCEKEQLFFLLCGLF